MPSHISSPWNYAISYLEMSFGDQTLASGSGFFWLSKGRTYLVSNWHNFAGRDPNSHQPIAKNGGVPDRIGMSAFKRSSAPDADGYFELEWTRKSIQLYDDN